jgi:hypothetical protein
MRVLTVMETHRPEGRAGAICSVWLDVMEFISAISGEIPRHQHKEQAVTQSVPAWYQSGHSCAQCSRRGTIWNGDKRATHDFAFVPHMKRYSTAAGRISNGIRDDFQHVQALLAVSRATQANPYGLRWGP